MAPIRPILPIQDARSPELSGSYRRSWSSFHQQASSAGAAVWKAILRPQQPQSTLRKAPV